MCGSGSSLPTIALRDSAIEQADTGAGGVPLEMNDMTMSADRYRLSYEWTAE